MRTRIIAITIAVAALFGGVAAAVVPAVSGGTVATAPTIHYYE